MRSVVFWLAHCRRDLALGIPRHPSPKPRMTSAPVLARMVSSPTTPNKGSKTPSCALQLPQSRIQGVAYRIGKYIRRQYQGKHEQKRRR